MGNRQGSERMGFGKNGYYSLREILGYNCKYNLILSERGIGKSWGTKFFLMGQEGKFMCLYRQQPDMMSAQEDWIDPLVMGDEEHGPVSAERFEWQGNKQDGFTLLFDGEVKGYFRYLTQVNHVKQEMFPDDLNWVWWDEFIPLAWKKLPGVEDEVKALRVIVKTIEHDTIHTREEKGLKPVRVLMFANPFTWQNPVLQAFKVIPRFGVHRIGTGIVCEMIRPLEHTGRRTAEDELGDEVHKNMGWADEGAFVEKLAKGSVPYMSLRFADKYFTIYENRNNGKIYVVRKEKHTQAKHVIGTVEGLQEDERSIESTRVKDRLVSGIYGKAYRYDTINTKFEFMNCVYDL